MVSSIAGLQGRHSYLKSRPTRLSSSKSLEMSLENFPAPGASTNEAGCEQQQLKPAQSLPLTADTPLLTTVESIKLDGRPVLCLEVEAAAEDTPSAAKPVTAQFLALRDLLLAVAVLAFCVVAGNVSADVQTAGMLVAAMVATVAAGVAVQKRWKAQSAGAYAPSLKAAVHTSLYRIGLEVAGAAVLAVYFPVEAVQQAAAAVHTHVTFMQRYYAVLRAINTLEDEEPAELFSLSSQQQQQQQQQEMQRAEGCWHLNPAKTYTCPIRWTANRTRVPPPLTVQSVLYRIGLDVVGVTLLALYLPVTAVQQVALAVHIACTAVKQYFACLTAISALGNKEPCALFQCDDKQQQQQQQQQQHKATVRDVFKQYLNCLTTIATLGDKEPCALFPSDQQQQQQQQRRPVPAWRQVRVPPAMTVQAVLHHMVLDLVGAVLLVAYVPVAVWNLAVQMVQQARSAVAATANAVSCFEAIGQLAGCSGERTCCSSSSSGRTSAAEAAQD